MWHPSTAPQDGPICRACVTTGSRLAVRRHALRRTYPRTAGDCGRRIRLASMRQGFSLLPFDPPRFEWDNAVQATAPSVYTIVDKNASAGVRLSEAGALTDRLRSVDYPTENLESRCQKGK